MTTKKCQYEENKISGWGKTSCPRARRKAVFTLVIEAIDTRNAATFVFATKQVNLARKLLLEAKEQYHDINSISAWRISDKQSSENWEKQRLPTVSLWYFDAIWCMLSFNTFQHHCIDQSNCRKIIPHPHPGLCSHNFPGRDAMSRRARRRCWKCSLMHSNSWVSLW